MLETINSVRTRNNTYALKVSIFRIDNEMVYDVLGQRSGLKIVETSERSYGTHASGALEQTVSDLHHVSELIDSFHAAHTKSQTSHLVWTVTLERTELDETGVKGYGTWRSTVISRMHFVETAALERSKQRDTKYAPNARRNLARSFDALCTVIHFLHRSDAPHIPYRNSKLTHLTKDCLGPSAETVLLHCVSPAAKDMTETVHTLTFAKKVRDTCGRSERPPRKTQLKIKPTSNHLDEPNDVSFSPRSRRKSPGRSFGRSQSPHHATGDLNQMLSICQMIRRQLRTTGLIREVEAVHTLEEHIQELAENNCRLKEHKDPSLSWANSEILNLQQENLKYKNQIELLRSEVEALNSERVSQVAMNQDVIDVHEARLRKETAARQHALDELEQVRGELARARSDSTRLEGEISIWRHRYNDAKKVSEITAAVQKPLPPAFSPTRDIPRKTDNPFIDSREIMEAFREDLSDIDSNAPSHLDAQIADLDRDFRKIENDIQQLESLQELQHNLKEPLKRGWV